MSVISDVQELYGTLHTTWGRIRVHVISHVVFFTLVFSAGGIALTNSALPNISARDIAENDWFKLAKDTGLIYVVLLFPVIVASVYLAAFELLGKILSTTFTVLFLAPRGLSFAGVSAWDLEPIASLLPNEDFTLYQISDRSNAMIFQFQEQKPNEWSLYQKELSRITGNSMQYLGDFCALLLLWIVIFATLPSNAWIQINGAHFWRVCLILSALILFTSVRASRALAAIPILLIKYVSAMLRTHPSLIPLDKNKEDERQKRVSRLNDLLEEEKKWEAQRGFEKPSFRRLFGLTKEGASIEFSDRDKLSFYERGEKLGQYGVSPTDLSIVDVLAYKFLHLFGATEANVPHNSGAGALRNHRNSIVN